MGLLLDSRVAYSAILREEARREVERLRAVAQQSALLREESRQVRARAAELVAQLHR